MSIRPEFPNLQDTMNLLFKGSSIAERGTLFQLKNDFGHNNVTSDVMNSFNFVDNFFRLLSIIILGGDIPINIEYEINLFWFTDSSRKHMLLLWLSKYVRWSQLMTSLNRAC